MLPTDRDASASFSVICPPFLLVRHAHLACIDVTIPLPEGTSYSLTPSPAAPNSLNHTQLQGNTDTTRLRNAGFPSTVLLPCNWRPGLAFATVKDARLESLHTIVTIDYALPTSSTAQSSTIVATETATSVEQEKGSARSPQDATNSSCSTLSSPQPENSSSASLPIPKPQLYCLRLTFEDALDTAKAIIQLSPLGDHLSARIPLFYGRSSTLRQSESPLGRSTWSLAAMDRELYALTFAGRGGLLCRACRIPLLSPPTLDDERHSYQTLLNTERGGQVGSPSERGGHTDSPSEKGKHTDSPSERGGHTDSPSERGGHTDSPSERGKHTDSPSERGGHTDSPSASSPSELSVSASIPSTATTTAASLVPRQPLSRLTFFPRPSTQALDFSAFWICHASEENVHVPSPLDYAPKVGRAFLADASLLLHAGELVSSRGRGAVQASCGEIDSTGQHEAIAMGSLSVLVSQNNKKKIQPFEGIGREKRNTRAQEFSSAISGNIALSLRSATEHTEGEREVSCGSGSGESGSNSSWVYPSRELDSSKPGEVLDTTVGDVEVELDIAAAANTNHMPNDSNSATTDDSHQRHPSSPHKPDPLADAEWAGGGGHLLGGGSSCFSWPTFCSRCEAHVGRVQCAVSPISLAARGGEGAKEESESFSTLLEKHTLVREDTLLPFSAFLLSLSARTSTTMAAPPHVGITLFKDAVFVAERAVLPSNSAANSMDRGGGGLPGTLPLPASLVTPLRCLNAFGGYTPITRMAAQLKALCTNMHIYSFLLRERRRFPTSWGAFPVPLRGIPPPSAKARESECAPASTFDESTGKAIERYDAVFIRAKNWTTAIDSNAMPCSSGVGTVPRAAQQMMGTASGKSAIEAAQTHEVQTECAISVTYCPLLLSDWLEERYDTISTLLRGGTPTFSDSKMASSPTASVGYFTVECDTLGLLLDYLKAANAMLPHSLRSSCDALFPASKVEENKREENPTQYQQMDGEGSLLSQDAHNSTWYSSFLPLP